MVPPYLRQLAKSRSELDLHGVTMLQQFGRLFEFTQTTSIVST